jgi:hypothetical protein
MLDQKAALEHFVYEVGNTGCPRFGLIMTTTDGPGSGGGLPYTTCTAYTTVYAVSTRRLYNSLRPPAIHHRSA